MARIKGDRSYNWMVLRVAFPRHAKTILRIRYEAPYNNKGKASYLFGTASAWNGKVGKLTIAVDRADVGGVHDPRKLCASLTMHHLSSNVRIVVPKNFEPAQSHGPGFYKPGRIKPTPHSFPPDCYPYCGCTRYDPDDSTIRPNLSPGMELSLDEPLWLCPNQVRP
ncbi:hypothetical protein ACFL2Q_11320 [Thermodesulfobacteriota bacterium]